MVPDAGSRLARAMGARWWSVIPTHVQYFTRVEPAHPARAATATRSSTSRRSRRRSRCATTCRGSRATRPRLARALVRGAERVGVADRMWAPDFRDRMLVIARGSRVRSDARRTRSIVAVVPDTATLEEDIQRIGRELAAAFPSAARHPLRALDERAMELRLAGPRAARGAVSLRRRRPGLPLARRPRAPPDELPRRGRGPPASAARRR